MSSPGNTEQEASELKTRRTWRQRLVEWRGGERREGIGMPDWIRSGLTELEARAGFREHILRRRIAMLREELARIEENLKSSAENPSQ